MSLTRRHFLEHMRKLHSGRGHAYTPSGGRELEHFTTHEAHRANFIFSICILYCTILASEQLTTWFLCFYSTLTFLYLPAHNFGMMLCPNALSYDWQMGSIPLLMMASGDRMSMAFLALPLFYGSLCYGGWTILRQHLSSGKTVI